MTDHLSRLPREQESWPLYEFFANEHIYALESKVPWYADIVNYIVTNTLPSHLTKPQKDKKWSDSKYYFWDDPYLWKQGGDGIIRRCVTESEFHSIISFCHEFKASGHFGPQKTTFKVIESGFY